MTKRPIIAAAIAATLVVAGAAIARQAKPATPPPAAKPATSATPATPADPGTHTIKLPAELEWADAPPVLPKGAKIAVLEGDPKNPAPFTLRIQFPPKYKIPPHWHPAIEHVTVVDGEFYMGTGETYDEKTAKKIIKGGFAVMPVKFAHYAFTKGKKTVIQLHGVGPWGLTYINPADDPRNAGAATPATPATPAKK